MRLYSLDRDKGNKGTVVIKLLPEHKEDLFTIYQIVDKDDEIVFKKMFTNKASVEENKKATKELMKFKIKVVSSEFDMSDEYLRYKGVTVTGEDYERVNLNVTIGKFLGYTVDYEHPITIVKDGTFNSHMEKLLKEAVNPESNSDTAAVVLQEGVAHVCLLTPSSTLLKQKIEISLPKKKTATDTMKYNDKTERFYRGIYQAMVKHFDFSKLRLVMLCSPGFYAKTLHDKVMQYSAEERNEAITKNKRLFLVAHCSTGYIQGISEVLKNPSYQSMLRDTKHAREALIMDDFLDHLNKDDSKAWYGPKEIFKASEIGAIANLLLTDEIIHSDDIAMRKHYLNLVDEVEKTGGKVHILSTLTEQGDQLATLTGIACILKYPLPDLDEGLEEEEEDE